MGAGPIDKHVPPAQGKRCRLGATRTRLSRWMRPEPADEAARLDVPCLNWPRFAAGLFRGSPCQSPQLPIFEQHEIPVERAVGVLTPWRFKIVRLDHSLRLGLDCPQNFRKRDSPLVAGWGGISSEVANRLKVDTSYAGQAFKAKSYDIPDLVDIDSRH